MSKVGERQSSAADAAAELSARRAELSARVRRLRVQDANTPRVPRAELSQRPRL
jgi:hypothetical protein